jgi:hypothetical protein
MVGGLKFLTTRETLDGCQVYSVQSQRDEGKIKKRQLLKA